MERYAKTAKTPFPVLNKFQLLFIVSDTSVYRREVVPLRRQNCVFFRSPVEHFAFSFVFIIRPEI